MASTVTPVPSSPIAEDRLFGQIADVNQDGSRIVIALEQLFLDEEANQAAIADGVLEPGNSLPNPIYIRDLHRQAELPLSESLVVQMNTTGTPDLESVEPAEFITQFRQAHAKGQYFGWYWFFVADGQVVRIEQQYVP